jgi:hypothetical protein
MSKYIYLSTIPDVADSGQPLTFGTVVNIKDSDQRMINAGSLVEVKSKPVPEKPKTTKKDTK